MNRKPYFISLLLFTAFFAQVLVAQSEDFTEPVVDKDEGKRSFFNNGGGSQALVQGGAFYVSNPPPALEIDPEEAYLRVNWEPLVVKLIDGRTAELTGRYRLVDQKFEIKEKNGDIYEIYSTMISHADLGSDHFILIPNTTGTKIYQIHYRDENYQLLSHHTAEWQDPPKQNMFDTSEPKRTLKKESNLLLLSPQGMMEVDKKKNLYNALGLEKGDPPLRFAKHKRLDLKTSEGITELLTYLAQTERKN